MKTVDAVLLHWRRGWTESIIDSLKHQTHPCRVILVDASADGGSALPAEALAKCDVVLSTSKNVGAWNRLHSIWECRSDYTLHLDDDLSPGPKMIEHFVRHAEAISKFAVLGQFGRMYPDGRIDRMTCVSQQGHAVEVDNVVRGYFMRTECFARMVDLKQYQLNTRGEDIAFSCGLKTHLGLKSYVTPNDGRESLIDTEGRDDGMGMCDEPEAHRRDRQAVLDRLLGNGWRPIIDSRSAVKSL